MYTPDSHVINILPDESDLNKENDYSQQDAKVRNYRISTELIKRPRHDGLSDEKIICRYREYANKFKENPAAWPNKRHQTKCKDIESACVIRKLYEKELTDVDILTIIRDNYTGYNAPESVLIDYITPAYEYGYTFMNYSPTFATKIRSVFSFGGKSHKKRKSHKKPRKPCKSRKSIIKHK